MESMPGIARLSENKMLQMDVWILTLRDTFPPVGVTNDMFRAQINSTGVSGVLLKMHISFKGLPCNLQL